MPPLSPTGVQLVRGGHHPHVGFCTNFCEAWAKKKAKETGTPAAGWAKECIDRCSQLTWIPSPPQEPSTPTRPSVVVRGARPLRPTQRREIQLNPLTGKITSAIARPRGGVRIVQRGATPARAGVRLTTSGGAAGARGAPSQPQQFPVQQVPHGHHGHRRHHRDVIIAGGGYWGYPWYYQPYAQCGYYYPWGACPPWYPYGWYPPYPQPFY